MMQPLVHLVFAVLWVQTAGKTAAPSAADMRTVESKYYTIETNIAADRAKFIGEVMDATGKEYARRFEGFRGNVRQKPKIRVFADREAYLKTLVSIGGDANDAATRGVFSPQDGIVYTYDGEDVEPTLKHECFHQFVHFVVGGRLPTWTNEGLAEYFAAGVFDEQSRRLRLGAVPDDRAELLAEAQKRQILLPVRDVLHMSAAQWHSNMTTPQGALQYVQAWALCHFLVHAEGGKFVKHFDEFLRAIDGGLDGDSAFQKAFGAGTDALQAKYAAYLRELTPSGPRD